MKTLQDRLRGALLGTAVADAIGLPAEGLSRRQIERRGWRDNWRHRLLFGRGMLSDDTEHSLLVAEALSKYPDDVADFRRCLGWKFRWWFASLPAGIGLATGRAIIKLWLGFSPTRSGVYSAGNGPAMRSAILGAFFHDDPERLRSYVKASTELTHTDPKALVGALAVAWCAALPNDETALFMRLEALADLESSDWPVLLGKIQEALNCNVSVDDFANDLGLGQGVSGYVYHTVPVALYAWLLYRGQSNAYQRTVTAVLNCGGDVDTVGAIAGAIAGAATFGRDIPEDWILGIRDWPRSLSSLDKVCISLNERNICHGAFWPFCLLRNLAFLVIVLAHGFARLIPRQSTKG